METVVVTSYLSVMDDGRTKASPAPMGHPVIIAMRGGRALVMALEAQPGMNRGLELASAMPKVAAWAMGEILAPKGMHPEDAVFFRVGAAGAIECEYEWEEGSPLRPHESPSVDESELGRVAAAMGMPSGVIEGSLSETRQKAEGFAQSRTARGKAALAKIKRTWPQLFEPRPRPFKIGIGDEMQAALDHLLPEDVSRALQMHCSTIAYKRSLREGSPRFGLDGQPAGVVLTAEFTQATEDIKRYAGAGQPAPAEA